MGEGRNIGVARAILGALLFAVLAGCSMVRIGYGHFDTFAAWTADDYFDLDAQQKQDFRARFDRLHAWHRYEQLPDYAEFFTATRARVRNGLERKDVLWVADGVKERYRRIVRHGADDAAAFLLTITPQQLEALQRRWDRINRDFRREYRLESAPGEMQRAREERMLARIRDWVGPLSDEQEREILDMMGSLPQSYRLRYEDRLRRQREFLQLMAQRDDPRKFAASLRGWLLDWESDRTPEYQRLFADWTLTQADFFVAVSRMLAPRQRAALDRRLAGYVNDFTRLAERPAEHAVISRQP